MGCLFAGGKTRRGFTLVELLVVIAIVIILLALLIPSISNSMSTRRQSECANNLKQIGAAIELARLDGETIKSDVWTEELMPHLGDDTSLLFCAEDLGTSQPTSYGMNSRAYRLSDMDGGRIVALDYKSSQATHVVLENETPDDWTTADGLYAARHLRGLNALLHTGGVKAYEPLDIDPRVCKLWKQYWRPHQDHQYKLEVCGDEVTNNVTENETEQPPAGDYDSKYEEYDGETCVRTDPQTIDNKDSEGFTLEKDDTPDFYQTYNILGTIISEFVFSSDWIHVGEDAETGAWSWRLHNDMHVLSPGHQTEGTRAVYEFKVSSGNKYKVFAYWSGEGSETYNPQGMDPKEFPSYGHSDSTPIRVFDGDEMVYEERVDQKTASSGAVFEYPVWYGNGSRNEHWYPLGEDIEATGDTLTVTISADAGASNGFGEAQYFNVVADAVRIQCTEEWPYHSDGCDGVQPRTIDDGGAGFSTEGDWTDMPEGDAEGGAQQFALAGSGGSTATYEFKDIRGGQYSVWAHFVPKQGQATNAPFTIYDGDHSFPTVLVNQSIGYLGTDLNKDGKRWYKVGEFEMRSHDAVRVVISNAADGNVVADAIRLECAFNSYSDECDSSNAIYGRECRQQYAEDYGSDEETEEAVANGLNWLSRHQYEGGHWSYDHAQATCPYIDPPEPCEGECGNGGGKTQYEAAATGMALLPFLGAGFGPEHPDYGGVVTAALNYLMDHTEDSGLVATTPGLHYEGYEQGIASLALAEGLGICRQSGFGEVDAAMLTEKVQKVVKRIVECQHPTYGGWRYSCGSDEDMTVSSWMIQTLSAASALGIDYEAYDSDRSVMKDIKGYLTMNSSDEVQDSSYGSYGSQYWYQRWWNPWDMGPQMGRFLRMVTGASPQAAGMQQAADIELARIDGGGVGQDSYRAYYAHHFMRQMGGDKWETWDENMQPYLLDGILPPDAGHERGSWLRNEGSQIHGECGRLWDTASASLCLEVYYRYSQSLD